ncbi:MAG: YajQ family cyclic di-GMP-binding protein [Gammaproteobacteria bacterium]|nr:YajQ family cyclic di-GMP-binding protein [Gammaproteobacteria bacterium]
MPSFDVVSEIDMHELANALDQVNREVGTRYDFKGSDASVEHQDSNIKLEAENEFQLDQMRDILHLKIAKRGIDVAVLNAGKIETSNQRAQQTLVLQQGVDTVTAKKVVKLIKDSKIKVQASIQGEQVRVTGKKRDELQSTMQMLRESDIELPLQFNNFRD